MTGKVSAMTWWQYVEQTAAGDKPEHIARRVDLSSPTVGRWRTSVPRPESVASFARAYGRPVLEAFVAAGFLTAEEADVQVTISRVEEPSNEQLLKILGRRLHRDRGEGEGSAQQPAAKTHAGASPATPTRADRDRVIASLVDELDGGLTVDDVRTAAAGILARPGRDDYVLAAQDRDDSEEIEAQQIDP